MTSRSILAALGAFAAGAALTLAATDALARQSRVVAPSAYTNGLYAFSIVPPDFAKADKDSANQTAMFFAPGKNGFANNLGVMVQNVKTTLDEYIARSQEQFKQGGLKTAVETRLKVSGHDAVLWEYEGATKDRKLKFLSLAVVDRDRVFLITGTSTLDDYDALSKEFRASLSSFKLLE